MSLGQPISRPDGPAKVTGKARYTGDTLVEKVAHAVIVPATIPKARITAIDVERALAVPGVVHVFTHENTPRFGRITVVLAEDSVPPLQNDRVLHEGQPAALVVAETLEQATEAAGLVHISYREERFETDFLAEPDRSEPMTQFFGLPLDTAWGDVAAAWKRAEVRVKGVYLTADRHHNPIEPAATLAVWEDDRLAQPPKATFVARLRPGRLPDQAARQLPDLSTTIRVEPSSTDDSRLRGALPGTVLRPAAPPRLVYTRCRGSDRQGPAAQCQ